MADLPIVIISPETGARIVVSRYELTGQVIIQTQWPQSATTLPRTELCSLPLDAVDAVIAALNKR